MNFFRAGALVIAHLAVILLPCGCEIDSADSFARDVSINFSGFYTACDGNDSIVQQATGARIRTLDLRQTGDKLEAIDNNSLVWRGSLGEPQNGRSSFELRGRTTEGVEGTFSGTLTSSDGGTTNSTGSADGSMTGTYIEPNRFSTFCATATIPGSSGGGGDDGGSGGSLAVSPSGSQTISAASGQINFTASGGTGSYTWNVSSASLGSLSTFSGPSVTYTRSGTSVGTQTLTLNDGSSTRNVTITQTN
ncbi:MAG TPA: hypothetical protein PKE12_10095 [Kiritimatiellia bacterium]|nr:hypothetical protein [Kiritimatiellia bacterium]